MSLHKFPAALIALSFFFVSILGEIAEAQEPIEDDFTAYEVIFLGRRTYYEGVPGSAQLWVPWIIHAGKKGLFWEVRHNFDWENSLGVFAGATLPVGKKCFLVPNLGFTIGDFDSISPQVYMLCQGGGLNFTSLSQVAFSLNKEFPNWLYNWSSLELDVWRGVKIGIGFQAYTETQELDYGLGPDKFWFKEAGPSLKLPLGNRAYVTGWYTESLGTPEFFPKTKKATMILGVRF